MAARSAADTYSFKRPALHRAGSVYTHTQSINTMKTTASSIKNIDHVSEGQYAIVQLSHARMEKYNPEVVTYVEPFSDLKRLQKLVLKEFEGSFTTSYKIAQRKGDEMICPFTGRDYGEYPSYR